MPRCVHNNVWEVIHFALQYLPHNSFLDGTNLSLSLTLYPEFSKSYHHTVICDGINFRCSILKLRNALSLLPRFAVATKSLYVQFTFNALIYRTFIRHLWGFHNLNKLMNDKYLHN